jgi:hypothetical protein
VLIGINLGFTGADGAGVGTKSISRLKSCLPTASGCHQEEAEPRYVAIPAVLMIGHHFAISTF